MQDKFGTAIILAGGKSSRMGFDKQFLKINEKRVMDIVVSKLETEFSEIIVVTNKPQEYRDYKYKIVSDIIKEKGPLSGLHVGLKNSKSKYAYFLACDMPNINVDYIRYMKEKIEKNCPSACVARTNSYIEVFNSFYSKDIYKDIENQLKHDKRSVNSLLRTIDTYYIDKEEVREFNKDCDMFMNLNTKDEVDEYIKNLKK